MTIAEVKDKVAQEQGYNNWMTMRRDALCSWETMEVAINTVITNFAREKIEEQLEKALKVLEAYEELDADIITRNECWAPEGTATSPKMTDNQFEKWLEIAEMRNKVLADCTRVEITK